MADPKATRLYLGQCPECDGLAIFTAVWIPGKQDMLTVIDCTLNDCQVIAKVDAEQASGQPMNLQLMYRHYGLTPIPGPVYTITENCPLTLPE